MFNLFSTPVAEICPSKSRALLKQKGVLVDVREADEVSALRFDQPEVINIPLSELKNRFSEIPRDRPVVLACVMGARSEQAARFLMKQGYDNVVNMRGGMAKWLHKGFPVLGDAQVLGPLEVAACQCGHGHEHAHAATEAAPKKSGCC